MAGYKVFQEGSGRVIGRGLTPCQAMQAAWPTLDAEGKTQLRDVLWTSADGQGMQEGHYYISEA